MTLTDELTNLADDLPSGTGFSLWPSVAQALLPVRFFDQLPEVPPQ
jgi:hypothetical protein